MSTRVLSECELVDLPRAVAGAWRYADGRVEFEPFEKLDRAAMRALRDEGVRMAAFHG